MVCLVGTQRAYLDIWCQIERQFILTSLEGVVCPLLEKHDRDISCVA